MWLYSYKCDISGSWTAIATATTVARGPATTHTIKTMTTFTILEQDRYRTDEFLMLLGRTMKRPLSDRTLREWCQFFKIFRDKDGYFWGEDLALLRAWIRYKKRHGRKRNRKDFLIEYEAKTKAKTANTQTQTIEVAAHATNQR